MSSKSSPPEPENTDLAVGDMGIEQTEASVPAMPPASDLLASEPNDPKHTERFLNRGLQEQASELDRQASEPQQRELNAYELEQSHQEESEQMKSKLRELEQLELDQKKSRLIKLQKLEDQELELKASLLMKLQRLEDQELALKEQELELKEMEISRQHQQAQALQKIQEHELELKKQELEQRLQHERASAGERFDEASRSVDNSQMASSPSDQSNQISGGDLIRLFGSAAMVIFIAIAIIIHFFPNKDSEASLNDLNAAKNQVAELSQQLNQAHAEITSKEDLINRLQTNGTGSAVLSSSPFFKISDSINPRKVIIKTDPSEGIQKIIINNKEYDTKNQINVSLPPGLYKISVHYQKNTKKDKFSGYLIVDDNDIDMTLPVSQ